MNASSKMLMVFVISIRISVIARASLKERIVNGTSSPF